MTDFRRIESRRYYATTTLKTKTKKKTYAGEIRKAFLTS